MSITDTIKRLTEISSETTSESEEILDTSVDIILKLGICNEFDDHCTCDTAPFQLSGYRISIIKMLRTLDLKMMDVVPRSNPDRMRILRWVRDDCGDRFCYMPRFFAHDIFRAVKRRNGQKTV